jgi:hypothetical protein
MTHPTDIGIERGSRNRERLASLEQASASISQHILNLDDAFERVATHLLDFQTILTELSRKFGDRSNGFTLHICLSSFPRRRESMLFE